MVWRLISALALTITVAQLLAVRRLLARPDRSRRRGDRRGRATTRRSLLMSRSREGSAMALWSDGQVGTSIDAPEDSWSDAPEPPAAGNVSPIDVLDHEALVALTSSRLDVDDLVARNRGITPADLPGDLPYAVLHCCGTWMERFTGTSAAAIGSAEFRQHVRGLLTIGCATGAVVGLALRDLPVGRPVVADREPLVRSGLRRAAATTSIDTLDLLGRNRELEAVASHVAGWARSLAGRAGVAPADAESFAAVCELAFADGVYLGLTAPSPSRHDAS
jgi:hypothetical protein